MVIQAPKPPGGGEAAILGQFAQGTPTSGDAGRVYMGRVPLTNATDERAGRAGRAQSDLWVTTDEALNDFYGWNSKRQRDFLAQGVVSGQLALGDGPMEAGKLWAKLVKEASLYGKAGQKVSPFDLLGSYVDAAGGSGKSAWTSMGAFQVNTVTGEKRYMGPGTYLGNGKAQQTDTRTDLTDPDTAKAIATKLFQDLMGRDPGQGELGAFATALSSAEAANPITQTTTTEYNMDTGQALASDTTSSGGVSAEGKAYLGQQQIKKKKEYGAVQAATTYQNAFDSLIYGAPE